jgi:hypothetical protein
LVTIFRSPGKSRVNSSAICNSSRCGAWGDYVCV